ncbi:hypothetical protein XBFFL1_910050 [Xenorhabdus bovienii str. feltiae Florida]|nr:hypothetical protein XBFFR1_2150022 [Xenorhabdus bovienii str. feltiae France]CDG94787.1 hypothetical protein XBFFL1_910050 [Xenorhabdus bovienii str. feltiae Florida]
MAAVTPENSSLVCTGYQSIAEDLRKLQNGLHITETGQLEQTAKSS